MSTPELTERLAPLIPHIPGDGANPFAEEIQHPATPVVLDAVDVNQQFRERPVSIRCPGCGTIQTRYRDGLPLRVAHFEQECETCATTLHRWAAVAVDTAYEAVHDPTDLRDTVTDYWETNLWRGITTGDGNPRTKEYSRRYDEQAATFGWDWQVSCPLCRIAVTELPVNRLDYHHWRHDPDQGVCLCRPCHDAIDGQQTDADLDWAAQQLGLRDKHDLQITRLALREQAVAHHDSLYELVECLHERYNLVQPLGNVFALLSQTLTDETILEAVDDAHLLAGLQER